MSDRIGLLFAELVREVAKEFASAAGGATKSLDEKIQDEWLRVPEAAKLLQVSKEWIYRAAARKRIPCKRVGGLLRFSREELNHWMRHNSTDPPHRRT